MRKLQFKFQWVGPAVPDLAAPTADARPAARTAAPRSASEQASARQGWFAGTRAYALRAATRASVKA